MAKDVASRCSGEDASADEARERIERAAAQFASIHDRWSALSADAASPGPNAPADALADEAARVAEARERVEPGVSVTPILGIDTSEASSPRPRFKTLLGVPRSSPDIDALAVELDPGRRRDTVRLERPAQRPPALPPAPAPAAATPATKDEPSLAATSWPWERNAPAPLPSPRALPAEWSPLAESSLDVSTEVAALRAASGRRYWFAGLAAVAAVLALFAVGAPRERTRAVHWLRHEVQARVHPSVAAITDTARSLRPTSNVAPPSGAAESGATESGATESGATESGATESGAALPAVAAATSADSVPGDDGSGSAALGAGRAARSPPGSEAALLATELLSTTSAEHAPPAGSSEPPQAELAKAEPPRDSPRARSTPASAGLDNKIAAPSSRPAARDSHNTTGNTSKVRQQVAAPRKRNPRSSATNGPAELVANATKPRATRQNQPRKNTGGGIIRETPF